MRDVLELPGSVVGPLETRAADLCRRLVALLSALQEDLAALGGKGWCWQSVPETMGHEFQLDSTGSDYELTDWIRREDPERQGVFRSAVEQCLVQNNKYLLQTPNTHLL